MPKITIIGSITQDIINLPSQRQIRSFGGIFYNLLALSFLNPQNAKIYPVCNLGDDIYQKVIWFLRKRRNIITEGINKSKGKNNQVTLFCKKRGKRKEFLLGLVPTLDFKQIKPYLNSDIILINFISGFDLSLETLQKTRRSNSNPIFIDIHSLALGINKDGERFPCRPKFWKEYIKCADMVQVNQEEFSILLGKKIRNEDQMRKWGKTILELGPKILLVTLGKNGAIVMYRENGKIRCHHSVTGSQKTVDTVGCGDVFASAFISYYLRGRSWKSCLDFAVCVASFKSGFSGTNGMRRLSRFALR